MSDATRKATDKANDNDVVEKNTDNLQNKAEDLKGKTADAISGSSDAIQKAKNSAQTFVSDKTDQVSSYAQQAYGKAYDKAADLGSRATEALSNSADYVRNIDVDKARETVKTTVQDKPELSIVIAALTGLVIGLVIGRTGKK